MGSELADAVTDAINGQTWSLKFEAQRRIYALQDSELTTSAVVSIFQGPRTSTRVTRDAWEYDQIIYVAAQKLIRANNSYATAEADSLQALVEEIESYFEADASQYAGYTFSEFDTGTERLPFAPTLLQQQSIFAAVTGLTFQR